MARDRDWPLPFAKYSGAGNDFIIIDGRTIVLQGGAYGEHRLERVVVGDSTTQVPAFHSPDRSSFSVRLAPGCGAQLQVHMKRYANRPSLAFPWVRD